MRLLVALWFAAGCAGDTPADKPDPTDDPVPDEVTIDDAAVVASEEIATVAWVSWTTEVPGVSWVEYGQDGTLDRETPRTAAPTTDHRVAVIGLKASGTYALSPRTELDDGTVLSGPELVHTAGPPPAVPAFTISDYDPSRVRSTEDLFVVGIALQSAGFVVVVDREGDVVWGREALGAPLTLVQSPKLGRDGHSLLWAEWDHDKQVDLGSIVQLNTDGTDLRQTPASYVHHDYVEHVDGTFGWLTTDIADLGGGQMVLTDRIVEPAPAGSADPMRQIFSYFDDYPAPFAIPCEHGLRTTNWGLEDAYEWTHTNSMVYDDVDDAYYVDARFFDALLKIDRATGQILWQLGGTRSDFTLPSGDPAYTDVDHPVLWSHGHYSHHWAGGFLMFDNGDHYPVPTSRVAEYAYDEVARTVEEVWSYERPAGDETFVRFLGDAKKLDNGNVLIVWSDLGEMTEVTPEGEVVWRLQMGSCCFGRGQVITGLYDVQAPIRAWR